MGCEPCHIAISATYWRRFADGTKNRFAFLAESSLSIPVNLGTSPPEQSSGAIAGSVLPIRRAEELILTLPGVLSVRIVPNENGAVDEVHVLTTDQVQPKHTVRNIESALMAQLGMRVNHRKISIATTLDAPRAADLPAAEPVAQYDADTIFPGGRTGGEPRGSVSRSPYTGGFGVAGALPRGGLADMAESPAESQLRPAAGRSPGGLVEEESGLRRVQSSTIATSRTGDPSGRRALVFEDVELRRSRSRGMSCLVTLSRSGEEFVGEAEGQDSEAPHVELAARAAVRAILAARGVPANGRGLSVDGARRLEAFGREYVFVSISARLGREPVVLTGSCEVRESAETSAVLAVLDATNRWLHVER